MVEQPTWSEENRPAFGEESKWFYLVSLLLPVKRYDAIDADARGSSERNMVTIIVEKADAYRPPPNDERYECL
jgi:hypothetical protein